MDLQEIYLQAQRNRDNGCLHEAVEAYQKIRNLALGSSEAWLAAECVHMIGVAFYQDDQYEEAEAALQTAEDEFRTLEDMESVGMVLRDRGLIAYALEEFEQAKDLLKQSIDLLSSSDLPDHLGISRVKLGLVEAAVHNPDKGEMLISQGISEIEESENFFFLSTAYFNLAQVQNQLGQTEKATASALKARDLLDTHSPQDEFRIRRREIDTFLKTVKKSIAR